MHKLLGGESKEVIAGADFGILDSFDELLLNIQKAVDKGFPRVKLKAAPGWDLDMLKAVRSTFPDITLHIDCNSGYTLDDLPLFKQIDKLNLAFIEQPLHWNDIIDHAKLAREIETPICLDETIHSVKAAEQALSIDACKYINIKPGRVGGLYNSKQIHDLAENSDQSERLANFEKKLFAWLRQRKQRTVVHLDELYKRSPEADEKAGIIIGRW